MGVSRAHRRGAGPDAQRTLSGSIPPADARRDLRAIQRCDAALRVIGRRPAPCLSNRFRVRADLPADPAFSVRAARRLRRGRRAAGLRRDSVVASGRTGTLWAYEQDWRRAGYAEPPRKRGGRATLGSDLLTDRVAACWSRAITAATFAGGPVVCRAALAVLAHIDAPAFLAHVRESGRAAGRTPGRDPIPPHSARCAGWACMIGVELDIEVAPLIAGGGVAASHA